MSDEPKTSKAEREAAAEAMAARVRLGEERAEAFVRVTQGAMRDNDKPGCRPSYPMPRKDKS